MKFFLIKLLLPIFLIECIAAGIYFVYRGRAEIPSFLNFNAEEDIASPSHPCNRMKTDVLLYLSHDTRGYCYPKGGHIINDDYVVYDANDSFGQTILTLGGSLTSGFYQHISNGETWPKILADLSKEKYTVLNGGVGSYSSLQELYKFIMDGPRIKNLKYVVTINGYNDIPDYHGDNNEVAKYGPFIHYIQRKMNLEQKWIDQRQSIGVYSFFPNTIKLTQYILRKHIVTAHKNDSSENYVFEYIDAADRWQKNVERMNVLVKQQNATYILFLQPTMGLEGIQSSPKKDSKDEKLFIKIDQENIKKIRIFYSELKNRCAKLYFCHDLSNYPEPSGDMYYSFNHPNEFGNYVIANKVWEIIKSNKNM